MIHPSGVLDTRVDAHVPPRTDSDVEAVIASMCSAMNDDDLDRAGALATAVAAARYGSGIVGEFRSSGRGAPAGGCEVAPTLSSGKLEHDIEQLEYLRRRGLIDGTTVDLLVERYRRLRADLDDRGNETRRPLTDDEAAAVGSAYGRLIHVRPTPRRERALSTGVDPAAIEERYFAGPGIVVVDDVLEPGTLHALQQFCLESTVWNFNRYPHGRLGAFFDAGFNCPLLLQLAGELRQRLPNVIGAQHPLRQLWGFKYPRHLPADSTIHADFAAVNVNIWITPDSANLDPSSGGLVIYDADAPLDWDFASYNEHLDRIKRYLEAVRARSIVIPYRANRAVIFNSNLFHATAASKFGPAYEDRRVNITMLFGDRVDVAGRRRSRPTEGSVAGRSAALRSSPRRSPALRAGR